MNGDFDATNNCSETINRAIKQYSSTGKKNRLHRYQSDLRIQNGSWPKVDQANEESTKTMQEDYRKI